MHEADSGAGATDSFRRQDSLVINIGHVEGLGVGESSLGVQGPAGGVFTGPK